MANATSLHRASLALALVALLLAPRSPGVEPPAVPEYQLKAEFIERFTRFIEWPAGADAGPFVIGVWGETPLRGFLQRMAGERKVKGRPLIVHPVADLAGLEGCHLLFVARSQRGDLARILIRTANRPILTVGDTEGFAAAGVAINFFEDQGRLRFELNEATLQASGLRVGAQLYQVARLVRPEPR